MQELKDERYDGLIATNERIYNRLTLGISLAETIDGDKKSYTLRYIDWQHPENSVYHVSDEFVSSCAGRASPTSKRPIQPSPCAG